MMSCRRGAACKGNNHGGGWTRPGGAKKQRMEMKRRRLSRRQGEEKRGSQKEQGSKQSGTFMSDLCRPSTHWS